MTAEALEIVPVKPAPQRALAAYDAGLAAGKGITDTALKFELDDAT